ncbi:MAG: YcbK family protein [Polyangiaceae bacterium]|nr:YcbK family protein [Polyangiaceae bacterium]
MARAFMRQRVLLLGVCVLAFCLEAGAKPKVRPAPRRATGAAYQAHVKKWHTAPADARAPTDPSGRPRLVLENVNTGARVELEAGSDDGGFGPAELTRASSVLGDSRKNREREMDSALLDLLYRLQRHFDAPCVRVVSAFRSGGASQHAKGRAADIVIPGVADEKLASVARGLGSVGVGLYPKSGFVHVDVRERPHYWVDASGPGAPAPHKPRARRKSKKPGKG